MEEEEGEGEVERSESRTCPGIWVVLVAFLLALSLSSGDEAEVQRLGHRMAGEGC